MPPSPKTGPAALLAIALAAPAAAAPTYTVVHHFGGPRDGIHPAYKMLQDANGTIWVVTPEGGRFGGGTIWRLDPSGRYRVFLSFRTAADVGRTGARVPTYPQGLELGADGQLIGTTGGGGAFRLGYLYTVSRTDPASLKILRNFSTATGSNNSGGLTKAADGTIWGPLAVGGPGDGGTIFSVGASGAMAIRHSFTKSGNDGYTPIGGLSFDQSGKIWATTLKGLDYPGYPGAGRLSQFTPGGALIAAYAVSFQPQANSEWSAGQYTSQPVIGPDGSLYGTSAIATYGVAPCATPMCQPWFSQFPGVVFRRTPDGTFSFLQVFGGQYGEQPGAGMVMDRTGALWGVTRSGELGYDPTIGAFTTGTFNGTVFRITSPAGATPVFETIHAFQNGPDDGARPDLGRLLLDRRGRVWGLTTQGGQYGAGTLFRIDPGT